MQRQVGRECMLYALAMVLDVEAEILRNRITMPKTRSLHPQELIDLAYEEGKLLAIIETDPYCTDPVELTQERVYDTSCARQRVLNYLKNARGVCVVRTTRGTYHAIAWDGKYAFDPLGRISDTVPENIYMFLRLVDA